MLLRRRGRIGHAGLTLPQQVRALFAAGEQGAWYDPSDLSTLFQDSAGTTPVTAVDQPVGRMLDKSGLGNHATQATADKRPLLKQDSNGRYHLLFDGSNDALATSSINFSSTDKMTVWAGIRKLSDAATGLVCELSANLINNSGAFFIAAPVTAGLPNLQFQVKGTTAGVGSNNSQAAPITAVVTGHADIATDRTDIRINGVDFGSGTVEDLGTGNFGNYAFYIGGRGGASLFFNGHLYGLIVRGAASSSPQIASMERYQAGLAGVTL